MELVKFNEISEGLKDHFSRGGVLESYSQSELNYIREIIPRNWDELSAEQRQETIQILDDRLAELSESGIAKALDSDSQIKQALLSVIEKIPVEKLEAPHDHIQTDQISDRLSNCKELRFSNWRALSMADRMQVLNSLEKDIASIEHRPPIPIYVAQLREGNWGGYNPEDKTITINSAYVNYSSQNPEILMEILDTLIHEGRHAYQDYNMNEREVHPRHSEIDSWRENKAWGYFGGNASELGARLYRFQPQETDARQFAQDVIEKLNIKLTA